MSLSEHIYFLDQILWEMLRLAQSFWWGDGGRISELSQDPGNLNMGGWTLNSRDVCIDAVSGIQDGQPGKLGQQPLPNIVLTSSLSGHSADIRLSHSMKTGAGHGTCCTRQREGSVVALSHAEITRVLPMNTYHFLAGRTNRKELIFWAIQSCTVFVMYFCFSAWLPGPRICGKPILPFPCQAGLSCQDELCSPPSYPPHTPQRK